MAKSQSPRGYPQRDTETDRTADVDVDLDGNELSVTATVVKTKTLEISELFNETPDDPRAEARLKTQIDPGHGWAGFEIRDGQIVDVNYGEHSGDGGEYLREQVVQRDDVVERIRECVEDEDVGHGYGDFAPRRPGAGF